MSELFDQALASVPKFILESPITAEWVDYNGKRKFAMLNFEESMKHNKLMIDLCYCATAGLINHRVEKTVPYSKKRFAILKEECPLCGRTDTHTHDIV